MSFHFKMATPLYTGYYNENCMEECPALNLFHLAMILIVQMIEYCFKPSYIFKRQADLFIIGLTPNKEFTCGENIL